MDRRCCSSLKTWPVRQPPGPSAFGRSPHLWPTDPALVGFVIVQQPETGRSMFEGMSYLEMDALAALALCPLAEAPRLPDIVVVKGPPEALMCWCWPI